MPRIMTFEPGVPPENKAQTRIRSSESCRWPAIASGRHGVLKTPALQTLQFFVPGVAPGRGRRFRNQLSIVACRQLRRDLTILLQVLFGTQFVMWYGLRAPSCSRKAPVFAHHYSKNLHIGHHQGATWLEARKVHSILRGRVFHERVPHKLRALILRHQ